MPSGHESHRRPPIDEEFALDRLDRRGEAEATRFDTRTETGQPHDLFEVRAGFEDQPVDHDARTLSTGEDLRCARGPERGEHT